MAAYNTHPQDRAQERSKPPRRFTGAPGRVARPRRPFREAGPLSKRYCHDCRAEYPASTQFCSRCGVPLVEVQPPPREAGLSGRIIADLHLEREVQRTPRGVLYRAEHKGHRRQVLVRLFRPRRSFGQTVLQAMHREVELAKRLTHPNILQAYELGQSDDGWFYLVMEHVDADPLDIVLREVGALEQELALSITRQVLGALQLAHSKGIIHRNLTPARILLARSGMPDAWVKLTEFGLSKRAEEDPEVETTKLVENQLVQGTPWYIAPEALRGDRTDHRVDLYAVGVILHQMLTGVIPFEEADAARLAERVLYDKPPTLVASRPGYPFLPGLQRVVGKSLAKGPARRYQTARAMGGDVQRLRDSGFSVGQALVAATLTCLAIYLLFGLHFVRDPDGDLRARLWAPQGRPLGGKVEAVGVLQWALGRVGAYPPLARPPVVEVPRLEPPRPVDGYDDFLARATRLGVARESEAIVREMAQIPAGAFTLGTDAPEATADEGPARQVETGLFYIDRFEVSGADYADFLAAMAAAGAPYPAPPGWQNGEPPAGTGDLPVTRVTWYDAALYAAWAGKQLPTAVLWEKAARGTDGRLWPWGSEFDLGRLAFAGNSAGPRPVDDLAVGASPYGVRQLAGNVREWTRDTYALPGGIAIPDHMIIRGGSFRTPAEETRATWRDAFRKDGRADDLGFRCIYVPR